MARGRKPSVPKTITDENFKRANGSGSVRKLSGNRRKPWQVYLTVSIGYDSKKRVGVQKRKSLGTFETKEQAELALQEYLKDPYDFDIKGLTFKDVYEMWFDRYSKDLKNPSSIRTITSAFNNCPDIHDRLFESITIMNMRDCIDKANVGNATKGRIKSMFNLMYDYAVEAQIVPVNLARNFNVKNLNNKIQRERKHKIPFSDELEDKLWNCLNYGLTQMILIGIYTGFRPKELCNITIDNINLEEKYIIGGMKTEAGTDRYVPIHNKIFDLVKHCYDDAAKYNCKTLFFILDNKNKAKSLTYDMYRHRFEKVMSALNVTNTYSPHCTRHTFITKAKQYNVNEYALKRIVGHEISDITEAVYTHRDNSFFHTEINKIQ